MAQEWKKRAPRAAPEPLRRPRRPDRPLWWPRRPDRPCTGFLRGHRRLSPIWGGSYPIWGCSRTGMKRLGSAKRPASVPGRDHKKRAPRARRARMSPLADIPRCNHSFTMPRGSCCKSGGGLPSSHCQNGGGHSPSRKTELTASQGAQRVDQRSGVDPA